MPKFWTNLVDSLPRESKSLTWRAPLVLVVLILSFLVFLPFRDTPYAIRVVHDTYDERGRVEPEARQVLSTRVTNWLVWFTSPFHYEMEREVSVKKLEPVGGREVRERTLEILSRGLNLGLDLRGGTELLYHILHDPKATGGATAEEIKAVVQRRIDAYGLREVRIQAQGAERLLVQLPARRPPPSRASRASSRTSATWSSGSSRPRSPKPTRPGPRPARPRRAGPSTPCALSRKRSTSSARSWSRIRRR